MARYRGFVSAEKILSELGAEATAAAKEALAHGADDVVAEAKNRCPVYTGTDNRLSNLRYGTRTENILDVYWQGKKWRKLGIDDVEEIRFAMYCGWSGKEIAGKFHVSETTISRIKCGRAYKWL